YNLAVPTERTAYAAHKMGEIAVINMSARGGSIFGADKTQWGRFDNDINMFNPRHVVILMDENPLYMTSQKEFELFHRALAAQRERGRLVFVVSASGGETAQTMKDGVRYIDLAKNEIRFYTDDALVWWAE
ncbi:MAG: hypothetical protein FWF96_07210, partial [Kiritimatiellaeota bacterium]|nr:hypothetical protein [Kiritimatiellota bacterium]